jgi:D-alanyl-D-alanine dipeptidase
MLVQLTDYFDQIHFDIKYATDDNFIGRPFLGYEKNICLLHSDLINPLQKVVATLRTTSYQLLIWDAYRPIKAIEDIYQWSLDQSDQKQKQRFYPRVDKTELFAQGYLSMNSSHSRGIALDLTLVNWSELTSSKRYSLLMLLDARTGSIPKSGSAINALINSAK